MILVGVVLEGSLGGTMVTNSNGGLAPKIGLLLGQSWIVIPMNKQSPGISPL